MLQHECVLFTNITTMALKILTQLLGAGDSGKLELTPIKLVLRRDPTFYVCLVHTSSDVNSQWDGVCLGGSGLLRNWRSSDDITWDVSTSSFQEEIK